MLRIGAHTAKVQRSCPERCVIDSAVTVPQLYRGVVHTPSDARWRDLSGRVSFEPRSF